MHPQRIKRQATLEQLALYLRYEPETGKFYWLRKTGPRSIVGAEAGSCGRNGYVCIQFMGAIYKAHRLAWLFVYGMWPTDEIDHINRVRNDNRIINLRDVSKSINLLNNPNTNGKTASGVRGVYKVSRYKYRAEICGKTLGYFYSKDEAIAARAAARKELEDA